MATLQRYPVGQKFHRNCSISHSFRDISILCFAIFVKNSKIQNGSHFWQDKKFWKNVLVNLQRYPLGPKFCGNRSITHGFRDTGIFVFSLFRKFIMII